MKILVMCQGKNSRWADDLRNDYHAPCDYKQLVPVNGVPLICRTLEQVRGVSNVVIIGHGNIYRDYHNQVHTLRDPSGDLIEGILRTTNHWENETDVLYLLGDVLYSNYAILTILSLLYITSPLTLYGRLSGNYYTGKTAKEIFALHVNPSDSAYDLLRSVSKDKDGKAKLWDVYSRTGRIVPIADYTDDIDSPQEYKLFFKELERRAYLDDKA